MACRTLRAALAAVWVLAGLSGAAGRALAATPDDRLAAARAFVEKSDRYLHHSKLRRGMEGYGLTVMEGTKVVKFKTRVISVVSRWGPHQDVILVWMSTQNLEHTGIIAGMSGSPVFFKDPDDGKFKMVGAVAYGWRGNKDPLGGVQPITQMVAAGEVFKSLGNPAPIAADAAPPAADAAGGSTRIAGRYGIDEFLKMVLDPRKGDFVTPFLPRRRPFEARPATAAGPRLVPLATPLMVSGCRPRTLADLARRLEPMGIVPVASGGVNAAEARAARTARLEPGAAVAVQIVSGDADMAAVGTVTDVVNGHVLAFGHSFYAAGDVRMPIGPAYIHTVVAGLTNSFKLGAGLRITGTLQRDEQVAVIGRVGPRPPLVPMKVTVRWPDEHRTETFHYNLCDHRYMTALFSRSVLMDSAWAWHELPEYHNVRYSVSVDYGKWGKVLAENVSTNGDVYDVASDLARPLSTLLNNPYGPRIPPRRIDVEMTIRAGDLSASMLDFKLAGEVYRPGETVLGTLTIRPARKARQSLPVRFSLPEDLPDGTYRLVVCDYATSLRLDQNEQPHRFAPRTTAQLVEAVRNVVSPPADRLYLRLPLPAGGGVALGWEELPDLPPSRAAVLGDAKILDTRTFRRSLVRTLQTKYIISGSAAAEFRIRRRPDQTLLREQKQ